MPKLNNTSSPELPTPESPRMSDESGSSVSTTSLVFERISERLESMPNARSAARSGRPPAYDDFDADDPLKEEGPSDLETGPFLGSASDGLEDQGIDRRFRKYMVIGGASFVSLWIGALLIFLATTFVPEQEHDPAATASRGGAGKKITLDQVQNGFWRPREHGISWIAGANGEDGMLLERGVPNEDYLVVKDVRAGSADAANVQSSKSLMKAPNFSHDGTLKVPGKVWPSRDLKKVLIATDVESNWRHSFTALYWIFDVDSQKAEPLIPSKPDARVQKATWSPTSGAIVFTRDNNLFLRNLGTDKIAQITKDGGPEYFYGVPDWVYEEEVFGSDEATWWSDDGKFVAFMRTNETGVPEYPIQYFVSRPSGDKPAEGEEAYPEERKIKYPKAGSHNPVVDLQFYDVVRGDVFTVDISSGFADADRLITTVKWAGRHVLVKETNRVSDKMRVVLVDVTARTGKTVRDVDVGRIDGGWFEISQKTTYVPADPDNGRPEDGYIDTVIHGNGDHLAYFSPLDNPEPVMLTSGDWEVVDAPSAVDLKNNVVWFVGTKESSIQRHVYSVKFDGSELKPFTDTSTEGYYGISFSSGVGYGLLTYSGPKVPWQKVVSTPSNKDKYEHIVEENKGLVEKARKHELPLLVYGTLKADGVDINYVERRPPHFDAKKQYPVVFQQYSGPGSQSVTKRFGVDFQSYMAAGLGYVVVTVDGRGTGFIGRKARVLVRENLGHYEAEDQILAAQTWARKKYVDASRIAIWGWSYGGFMALKTLERDGGRTFRYGMSVAPVTDWRFYDSIYTERYMLTPQENGKGYDESAVSNVTALGGNVRFLLMHGVADDNVHLQNSLTLLDKLDLEGVENYDVHVFPDSDHGISFHNANKVVYDKLNNWIINAFNGEWLKISNARPKAMESTPE